MSLHNRSKDPSVAMAEDYQLQDSASSNVPEKYRGTAEDDFQMKVMGRVQELRRNLTFITMLGFGSTLICTWEVVMANILPALTNGGTAGFFWGWILVTIGFFLVYASLSKMASMAPTSGGQYHWYAQPKRGQHVDSRTIADALTLGSVNSLRLGIKDISAT